MKHKGMERKIRLKTVNAHIICGLCKGYLVDATTITECLHTFCKSCIVSYLQDHNTCPRCEIVIHQSHPLNYISHDRTMQDIVFKLVPKLQENEEKKHREFYKKRGLPMPNSLAGMEENGISDTNSSNHQEDKNIDNHRSDEQVNLCLECNSNNLKMLKRKFIRCSSQATITHLKKFLALKLYNNLEKYRDVDILLNEELLGKDHTLKFICITRWRFKDTPLRLHYRPRVEL